MRGLFSRPTRIYADASSSSSTDLRTSQRRESYEAEEVADELAERTRRYFAVILREGLLAPLGSAYAPIDAGGLSFYSCSRRSRPATSR